MIKLFDLYLKLTTACTFTESSNLALSHFGILRANLKWIRTNGFSLSPSSLTLTAKEFTPADGSSEIIRLGFRSG